jgi:ubiquitin conjugation factor E4 B
VAALRNSFISHVICCSICDFIFQRSFRKELFEDAANRMERARIKTPSEIEQFRSLAEKAHEIAIQNIKKEVDYSDAPDEFRGKSILVMQDLYESVT